MAKFAPIFEPIEEEKKYTGGFIPLKIEEPIEYSGAFTPIEKPKYSGGFTPIIEPKYSGGFEPIEEPAETYEVDVGKYPLLVPTSKSIEFGGQVFVKGMWGEEAKTLEGLPKTQYTPVDVSDVDYSGSFVKSLLFDVLQRGEFAVANVVDRALKGETDFVQAALNGFTGKEKRDFVDVAMGLGLEGAEALAVGMVAGVTLDPINYIPFYKMYKGASKLVGKTRALEMIEKTSLADFLNKAFTSGEGAPKELHRVIRFLRKEKRWAESNVFERVEKLSKMMKTTENAELLTKVRALKVSVDVLTPKAKKVIKFLDSELDYLAREGVKLKMIRPENIKANYIPGYYDGLTKVAMDIKSGHRGAPFFTKMQNVDNIVDYNNARNSLIEGVQKALRGDRGVKTVASYELGTLAKKTSKYKNAEEFLKAQKKYYHGTGYDFDEFLSAKQLKAKGISIQTANELTESRLVFFSESRQHAQNYANQRLFSGKDAFTSRKTLQVKEGFPINDVLDLTKTDTNNIRLIRDLGEKYDVWTFKNYQKIDSAGQALTFRDFDEILGRPAFGRINMNKLEDLLRKENYSGIKFYDKTMIGSTAKSVGFLPDQIKTKQQLTDLFTALPKQVGPNLDEAKGLVESFPMASGKMLVDDASNYTARQLLLKAKSVPKPTMNLIESTGYRKLAHINELYRQKVINTVLDPNLPYAKPIGKMTNKTVKPGNAYFIAKYRLPDINMKEADEVSQALYKRVAEMAKSDLIEIEPKMAEELLNSPYMQKIYKGRGMRVFEMPQRIADYMNKTSELFTVGNKQAEQVLKAAAKIQNMWKPLATIARPFWHIRNVTYNQMQLFLSGVSPWDLVPTAIKAQAIQRGRKGIFQTNNFGKIKLPFLTRNSKKLGLYGVGFAGGDITTEGLLKSKMVKALRGGKLGIEDFHVKTLVQRPAEFMEDNAHLVAWLDYIKKSKDPDIGTAMLKGAEHAFKYVFDYGDISTFERSYMKLIDPFYCVSEDTECLTNDGWKKYNEIKKDNKLLTYNLKTKKLEWQKHQGIFDFDYDGELVSFDSKNINLLCTPNHRCITEEMGIREAVDVSEYGNHCPMVGENIKKDFDIPDRILSLLGWVITDGYVRRDYGDIVIYQKKYNDIIKKLLGNSYGSYIHPDTGVTQFRITGELRIELKKWFKYGLWKLVIQLSNRQCNIMKEAIVLADGGYGYKDTKKEYLFIAQQKGYRDLLQLIWFLAGYNCKLGKRGFYERNIKSAKYLNKKLVSYKGKVWCPSTKNTTAIFRRNGVITISGQTWHRKAVGLYASELLQHPDKFSKLGKAKRTLGKATPETEQEKALKPDWMKEAGYIKSPFKNKEGKPYYIDIAMPPDDLQMLFSMKDMYGVLTPYKVIFELLHGVTGFPELGTLEEGETPAPAWMVSLPEKTWKLLKLRPGRQIDYSTGTIDNVLMIPKAYLRAIETALPTMRDVHNMFPQPIKLSLEKATTKTWSQGTGVGMVTENITGWKNAIYYEIQELQKEITKEAKKYEGVKFKDKEYNYTESKEYLEKMQRIRELSDKLRY